MCAILDASVVHKVFGNDRPEAGKKFFEWFTAGNGRLVGGGEQLRELDQNHAFREWRGQAQRAGRFTRFDDHEIDDRTRMLEETASCQSNDPHVIALAQVSGARFLYSDDGDLHRDFGNRALIDNPQGAVYSTSQSDKFTRAHRKLLGRRNVCRA